MLPNLLFISILASFIFITHSCLHHQKTLLLQLRNDLIFEPSISTKLVKWNESDECCKWHGVECDAAGYVVSLQLDNESISGGIADSSSLFKLEYLENLNLAYNKFNYTLIPRGIHNLTYLTHLNLSNADFGGQVPAEISSLRRLVSLDISSNYISVKLEILVQNLTGLRELYLDYANISSHESRKWSHIISSYMPNITTLSLEQCGLSGPFARSFSRLHSLSILQLNFNPLSIVVPDLFAKLSSLSTLSLVGCGLKGSFPSKIFHIPTLQNLQLSYNEDLNGNIPPFTQIGSLKSISLSNTNFSGLIPSSVSNLKTLSEIDLSGCQFRGSIPSTLANLTQLIYVDLSRNFLTSSLSSMLFEGLPNLVYLDLRGNRLEGPIPDSFFQLESLESVFLSGNLFNGTLQIDKMHSLVNLTYLDLSGINLSLDVHSSTQGLPRLQDLRLASCNLYDFPELIKHSNVVTRLDLSNNEIAGEIPNWIWGRQLQYLNLSFNLLTDLQKPCHIPASLRVLDLHSNQLDVSVLDVLIPANTGNRTSDLRALDLSNNRIAGEIPSWIWQEQLWYLSLANNSLSGSIPTSVCNATSLDVLDLSVNELNGSIPSCFVDDTMALNVLDLGQNNISGSIPDNFPMDVCSLQYLDLNNNRLQGKIPKSLERCEGLQFMNVGSNIINDTFPCMLSSSLRVLVLHSNGFHGELRCQNSWPNLQILDISSNDFIGSLESINFSSWKAMVLDNDANFRYSRSFSNFLKADGGYAAGVRLTMKGLEVELVKIWPDFTCVDFSCNNLGGEIPNAIGDLSALRLLNLSHNDISGSIPKSFGKMGELEALDLSKNQLTGLIPMELTGLTFLSVLNLSYNKLVGMIPNGRQFQTFSADFFKGNTGLCGFNLNISCSDHLSPQENENREEKSEIEWEYVSAAVGYVVGLGIIVWLLLFSRSFREKYFGKVEVVFEDICDARDKKRRRARRVVKNRVRRQ